MQSTKRPKPDPEIRDKIAAKGYMKLNDYKCPKMQRLGQLVLNDKLDIRYSPNAAIYSKAEKFAKNKDLIRGPYEDINDDKIDDVVLYDKYGNPKYINGYYLGPSTHRLREKYHEDHPSREDQIRIGGWTGYRKGFLEREDARTWLNKPEQKGYFVPPEPRKPTSESLYRIFINDIGGEVQAEISERFGDKTKAQSAVPAFTICSLCYIKALLRNLWLFDANRDIVKDICNKKDDPTERYELFKKAITTKKMKPVIIKQYQDNESVAKSDATGSLDEVFEALGVTEESIAALPENDDLDPKVTKKSKVIENRVIIEVFKTMVSDKAAEYREQLIEEIFSTSPDRSAPGSPFKSPEAKKSKGSKNGMSSRQIMNEVQTIATQLTPPEGRKLILNHKKTRPDEIHSFIKAANQLMKDDPDPDHKDAYQWVINTFEE